jgi:S1-C subfamily serine protease
MVGVLVLSSLMLPVHAQLSYEELDKSLVKVLVPLPEANNYKMATGFIWEEDTYVVTALHAMSSIPNTPITVICKGERLNATVEKVLRRADLVLLKTEQPFHSCKKLSSVDEKPQGELSQLKALVYNPGVPQRDIATLTVKEAPPMGRLTDNITPPILEELRKNGFPDVKLNIYRVSGGIYPGNSGGPVYNLDGALVGIVSGGLDKGVTNKNWLVPSLELTQLLKSEDTEIPTMLVESTSQFSALVVGSSGTAAIPIREQASNQIGEEVIVTGFSQGGDWETPWFKSKTREFATLKSSSSPLLGIDYLWELVRLADTQPEDVSLLMNVYQNRALGVIVTTPQGVHLEQLGDGSNRIIGIDNKGLGDVLVQQITNIELEDGTTASPMQEDYLQHAVTHELEQEGCKFSTIHCELEPSQFQLLDYGQGNKILRVAFFIGYTDENNNDAVDYKLLSIVQRNDKALLVSTRIGLNDDILACINGEEPRCNDDYWTAASFVLANGLTSFSDSVIETSEQANFTSKTQHRYPQLTDFAYSCQNNLCRYPEYMNDQTLSDRKPRAVNLGATYIGADGFEQFVLEQDGTWYVNSSDGYYKAMPQGIHVDNSVAFQVISLNETFFAIPFTNGQSYVSDNHTNEWELGPYVYRQDFGFGDVGISDFSDIYVNERSEEVFLLGPKGDWLVSIEGRFYEGQQQDPQSVGLNQDEYFVIRAKDRIFALALNQGMYYEAINQTLVPQQRLYHIPLQMLKAANTQIIKTYESQEGVVFELSQTAEKQTWLVNIDGYFYPAQFLAQEDWGEAGEYTILTSGDDFFAVPINGGLYYYSYLGTDWVAIEEVVSL